MWFPIDEIETNGGLHTQNSYGASNRSKSFLTSTPFENDSMTSILSKVSDKIELSTEKKIYNQR